MSASVEPRQGGEPSGSAMTLPILATVLIVLMLLLPDQVREIYRVHAEAWAAGGWRSPRLLFAAAALLVLCLFLWRLARELSRLPSQDGVPLDGFARSVLAWMPRLVAALPWFGAAGGLWMSANALPPFIEPTTPAFDAIYPRFDQLREILLHGAVGCAAVGFALFVIITLIEVVVARWRPGRSAQPLLVSLWPVYLAIVVVTVAASLLFGGAPFVAAGAIPVFVLWTIAGIGLLANLWRMDRRGRTAVIVLLLIGILAFDYLGWNNNHEFRSSLTTIKRPGVDKAFDTWLSTRKDLEAYRNAGAAYPVYIVAAEGGGLYAAYHVGKFLARMQDICPSFAQHLFAISAVSGGSLGAAMFSALARDHAKNQDYVSCRKLAGKDFFETQIDRLLTQDYLSPVVTAALFPDFVQRFLPYPIPSFDRARALEASFEEAWSSVVGNSPNRLADSFLESCGPAAASCLEGATPALVLNLTQIDTGVQLALSPIDMGPAGPPASKSGKIYDALETGGGLIDLPMSTAVGLSARAPWITPSGWFASTGRVDGITRTYRFADGAYAEGSGSETAYKLAQLLTERIKLANLPGKVEVRLILLSATSPPLERFWIDPPSQLGYGELAVPFIALSSARRGQAFTKVYDIAIGETDQLKIAPGQIYDALFPLPLAWHLSQTTREYIDLYSGNPDECRGANLDIRGHWSMAPVYVDRHDCLAKVLISELSPMP
jgi:hypothetical protein